MDKAIVSLGRKYPNIEKALRGKVVVNKITCDDILLMNTHTEDLRVTFHTKSGELIAGTLRKFPEGADAVILLDGERSVVFKIHLD